MIVGDLGKLADLGLPQDPRIRFASKNLCWTTHNDTWEKAWEVVTRVDRPNFGLCLHTLNIAGRVRAGPTSPHRKLSNADEDLQRSIQEIFRYVDRNQVFYFQVVDAGQTTSPIMEGHPLHVSGQPSRMTWSRNARWFAYEVDRSDICQLSKLLVQSSTTLSIKDLFLWNCFRELSLT